MNDPLSAPNRDEARFCVFILSHGRPDRVLTVQTILRDGYTGEWFIVVDNEDSTREEYIRRFGEERIIIYDKAAIARTFDTADLSTDRRTVVFARNACWQIARERGYEFFLELDDDYKNVQYRAEGNGRLLAFEARNLDGLFAAMVRFLRTSGIASVALAQGGDHINGIMGNWKLGYKRKAMNSFFLRAADEWRFVGRLNEDVNAYTALAHRGLVFLTPLQTMVVQQQTQSNAGGMTDVYLEHGTYAKSFYSVMMCPSAVGIITGLGGNTAQRIHHKVRWNHCAPKILSERWRKRSQTAAVAVSLPGSING